jgi:5-hydroxyisourate hydrolase
VSSLSTHVLDAVSGTPAADVTVTLAARSSADGSWRDVANGSTDADGRIRDLAPSGLPSGTYRLVFDTGAYFSATGQTGFWPEVAITFVVSDERHYHVPLLLSPYAFSTYRGS